MCDGETCILANVDVVVLVSLCCHSDIQTVSPRFRTIRRDCLFFSGRRMERINVEYVQLKLLKFNEWISVLQYLVHLKIIN